MIENIFEGVIWRSRFIVILAVIFGLIGAFVLFIVASIDIYNIATNTFVALINHTHPDHFHENIVAGIIGAVDLYLIAVVMFIFSFGLYELFISDIDEALSDNNNKTSKILAIHSLDQLKDKIAKVIIMVLIVNYFQKVLHMTYETPLHLMYFALSIMALSLGLYFLNKVKK